jgi:iron-sulfur cluster assembly protein
MMAIHLTTAAANHVQQMLQQRGHGLGLRLATKTSGCTGFSYVTDYADALDPDDRVFESHGVKVVVNRQYLTQLAGTEIDYVTSNVLNSGFEFHNPNVKDMCGCGESFNVG